MWVVTAMGRPMRMTIIIVMERMNNKKKIITVTKRVRIMTVMRRMKRMTIKAVMWRRRKSRRKMTATGPRRQQETVVSLAHQLHFPDVRKTQWPPRSRRSPA